MKNTIKIILVASMSLFLSACEDPLQQGKLFCGHIATAEGIAISIGGWVDKSKPGFEQQCDKLVSKAKRKIPKKDSTLFGPKKGIECSDTEDTFGYNICTATCIKKKENRLFKVRQYTSDQKGNQKYCRTT